MNGGFKQRLIGAVVLTCGALIVWPMLFSEGIGPRMNTRSQIPPMPAFKKYEVAEPERPAGIVPVKEPAVEKTPPKDLAPLPKTRPKPTAAASKPGEKKAPVSKPALDEHGLPRGYVLQVASFSASKNAEQLKAGLQKQGYKAFTREVETANGPIVRVYIGPKLSEHAFDRERAAIDKRYKVHSIVVRFEQ